MSNATPESLNAELAAFSSQKPTAEADAQAESKAE